MAGDEVYGAIADPTRRSILDLLRDTGPLRAGDIAGEFESLSRPAVSRHLKVLRLAGLVDTFERGRERWYRLEPEPLADVVGGWLAGYRRYWQGRLADLKRIAENEV